MLLASVCVAVASLSLLRVPCTINFYRAGLVEPSTAGIQEADMLCFVRFLSCIVALLSSAAAQNNVAKPQKPDAQMLINQTRQRYEAARSYRIETISDTEYKSELSRQWDRAYYKATLASGNRYRFEGRSARGWLSVVSDGKTEWMLDLDTNMYTQTAARNAPFEEAFSGPISMNRFALLTAEEMARSIPKTLADLRSPSYVQDETLTLDGKQFPCFMITATGRYRGGSRDVRRQFTYWIDKETHVVRKVRKHAEGAIISNEPNVHVIQDEITEYPVAELDPASFPDTLFKFAPPTEAKLVDHLPNSAKPGTELVGKTVPEIKLGGAKAVSLSDFRGKPVLMEMWATWCRPCVAAMPSLKKLYEETSPKGLVLISIDEDEDEKTAANFWAKHGAPWTNYHDADGDIQREFPPGGVPEVVLIDASGKIVYAQVGYSEAQVRAAIAKLGPEYASVAPAKP